MSESNCTEPAMALDRPGEALRAASTSGKYHGVLHESIPVTVGVFGNIHSYCGIWNLCCEVLSRGSALKRPAVRAMECASSRLTPHAFACS